MVKEYKSTYIGCFIGIVTQAVVATLTPVLFVAFMSLYGFGVWQLGVMVGVNYISQLAADLILTAVIDKTSYRKILISSFILATIGLVMFGLCPLVLPERVLFFGMLASTVVFSFAGGMQEVIISPVVDAVPNDGDKGFTMSLFHSFYAWGQFFIIVATSLFLVFAGQHNWWAITFVWTVLPLAAIAVFARCPVPHRKKDEGETPKKTAIKPIMVLCMIAIFMGGGTEMIVNQYISTFCSIALGFEKYVADIVGMGIFALCMGMGRVLVGKVSKKAGMVNLLIVSAFATAVLYLVIGLSDNAVISTVAAVLCGFTVALLWPGVLTVAGDKFPTAGAVVFALLAVAGDLGGALLPMAAGVIGDRVSLGVMFAVSAAVPLMCGLSHIGIKIIGKKKEQKN